MSRGEGAAPRWGIVADDLTGAADTATVFADHGHRVRVHLDAGSLESRREPDEIDAVVTSARHLVDHDARAATAEGVASVMKAGATRIYLKIDSAGRGSVAAQTAAAVAEVRRRRPSARALVCPAYPRLGRTVVDGVIHVDGRPASQSAAGTDPVAPLATDRLRDLVGGEGAEVVDARDDAELAAIAHRVRDDDDLVPVGSAGLAASLARSLDRPGRADVPAISRDRLPVRGPIVVASSSLHPVAISQIDALRGSDDVVVVVPPADAVDAAPLTPSAAALVFAEKVAETFDATHAQAVVLVGGDGALAALRRLRASSLSIDGSLRAGCPTGVVVGGQASGIRVVTKSGGFGHPDTLVDLVALLRHGGSTAPDFSARHVKDMT